MRVHHNRIPRVRNHRTPAPEESADTVDTMDILGAVNGVDTMDTVDNMDAADTESSKGTVDTMDTTDNMGTIGARNKMDTVDTMDNLADLACRQILAEKSKRWNPLSTPRCTARDQPSPPSLPQHPCTPWTTRLHGHHGHRPPARTADARRVARSAIPALSTQPPRPGWGTPGHACFRTTDRLARRSR